MTLRLLLGCNLASLLGIRLIIWLWLVVELVAEQMQTLVVMAAAVQAAYL
jgi:hypothetical protein